MLTTDDLDSLRGVTIIDSETRADPPHGGVRLRLLLAGGSILGIEVVDGALNVADETSIPWGTATQA